MLKGAVRLFQAAKRPCIRGQKQFSDLAGQGGKQAADSTASTSGAKTQTTGSSTSRLFENVTTPPEAAQASSSKLESGVGRAFSAVGNALFFGLVGTGAYFGYYTYRYSPEEVEALVSEVKEDSFPGSTAWKDMMAYYVDKRRYIEAEVQRYRDPPSEQLLPDLPPQLSERRTLVLDLDDTLVHSDWTRERGWRVFKRPGAEAFIAQMAPFYELVVYTSQLPTYADPILDRLDPNRVNIQYRLYRDSTQYTRGKHVRDLAKLNRDPAKVLLLTANPDAAHLQPQNAIKIKPWKLDADDTLLLDMIPFLEAVVRTNVPDVRDVVKSYEGQDIPTAFKERMQKVQQMRDQQQTQRRGIGNVLPAFGTSR